MNSARGFVPVPRHSLGAFSRAGDSAAKARGFTLIELLVAVAIFALMAALAYGGLDTLLRQRGELETHYRQLHTLQRAYAVLQADFTQAAPRPVRDELGGPLPALRGAPDGTTVALSRDGFPNPAAVRRSRIIRVRYRLDGRRLLRLQWPVLDRAPGAAAPPDTLLDHVESLQFRYVDAQGDEQSSWPPAGAGPQSPLLPRAVRVTLKVDGLAGPVTWLFVLP